MHAAKVPPQFHYLFWDTDVNTVDPVRDKWFVVEKVVNYGTIDSAKWLLSILALEDIVDILKRNYNVSTKAIKLWGAVLNFNYNECSCMRRPSQLRVFDH